MDDGDAAFSPSGELPISAGRIFGDMSIRQNHWRQNHGRQEPTPQPSQATPCDQVQEVESESRRLLFGCHDSAGAAFKKR
jgi:hypothetical protein